MKLAHLVTPVVVALAATAATPAAAADRHDPREHEKQPFGPWDAGEARPVTRQGVKGKERRAHPAAGTPAKVPGDGPAPPPLRLDPYIPELALESPNAIGGVGGLSSNPLWLAALTYQNLLTRLDGPRCQHLPTCSRFASQAVARHGAVGILMGLDRLIRPTESSALRHLPEVEGWGGVRGFDPVENYEFWKTERFTGLPVPTAEEPLLLPPLPTTPPALPAASAAPASSTSP